MNTLELEYKQSTGDYPRRRIYGHITRNEGVFLSQGEDDELYGQILRNDFATIASNTYVEWLEEELLMARKLLTI